jgi:hypothetical protein
MEASGSTAQCSSDTFGSHYTIPKPETQIRYQRSNNLPHEEILNPIELISFYNIISPQGLMHSPEGNSSRAITMGLLHSTSGGSRLSCSLEDCKVKT